MTAPTAPVTAPSARSARWASHYANHCADCALPRRGRRRSGAVARSDRRRPSERCELGAVAAPPGGVGA